MKGNKNPMYGKPKTEKQIEATRQAHKDGKIKFSDQWVVSTSWSFGF